MISHVTTGVVALMAGELTARHRIVASVVRKRLIGLVIMALLPMMPTYWLDAMCYLLRSTLSRGSAGVQPPLTAGIVQEEPGASTQVAPAAGLVIPGALFGLGQFGLTFSLRPDFRACICCIIAVL